MLLLLLPLLLLPGEGRDIELRHQRNPDVIFDCVRAVAGGQKPTLLLFLLVPTSTQRWQVQSYCTNSYKHCKHVFPAASIARKEAEHACCAIKASAKMVRSYLLVFKKCCVLH
jgi:hypothetical protein